MSLLTLGRARMSKQADALDKKQLQSFHENGYVVLPKFFSDDELAMVQHAMDRAWGDSSIYNNLTVSAYTGTPQYTETYLRNVDRDARNYQYKLNHLYLYDARVLGLLMSDKLQKVLGRLLDGTPLMFNGLNFEKGSEQRFHFDTFYMPPKTYGKMVATWIALEDIHPDSGPLNYYPKSNQIPAYRFGHGGIWAVPSEMPEFDKYVDREIAERGLRPEGFSPKKGDMFIWHAQLYHGGGKINDRSRTRKSMVNHFWTVEDDRERALEVAPGKFMLRNQDIFVSPIFKPVI